MYISIFRILVLFLVRMPKVLRPRPQGHSRGLENMTAKQMAIADKPSLAPTRT